MDVRQVASVRHIKASLLGVSKENSEETVFLPVIGRKL